MTEKNRFAAPDPALAAGTTHAGFTVTRVESLPEISGQARRQGNGHHSSTPREPMQA